MNIGLEHLVKEHRDDMEHIFAKVKKNDLDAFRIVVSQYSLPGNTKWRQSRLLVDEMLEEFKSTYGPIVFLVMYHGVLKIAEHYGRYTKQDECYALQERPLEQCKQCQGYELKCNYYKPKLIIKGETK